MGRFRVEFPGEKAAAGLELRQCRAALPAQRQHPHQLPMRLFAPRIEFDLARGIVL
jgi:hypothetical protein